MRPYNENLCRQIVTEKYETLIRKKFGNYVSLDFQHVYGWIDYRPDTPRLRAVSGIIPCASFYYLDFLIANNPDVIYDIGCGMNFFKGIVPNIVGIDGDWNPDIWDVFDEEFANNHKNFFQKAFTINALHFCSILDFCKRINDFAETIAPGGQGYIAMNAARMMEHTNDDIKIRMFGKVDPEVTVVSDYFDNEIKKLNLNFLVAENLIDHRYDECIDGNIRLIFQK